MAGIIAWQVSCRDSEKALAGTGAVASCRRSQPALSRGAHWPAQSSPEIDATHEPLAGGKFTILVRSARTAGTANLRRARC